MGAVVQGAWEEAVQRDTPAVVVHGGAMSRFRSCGSASEPSGVDHLIDRFDQPCLKGNRTDLPGADPRDERDKCRSVSGPTTGDRRHESAEHDDDDRHAEDEPGDRS
jgi:hypothetical protein